MSTLTSSSSPSTSPRSSFHIQRSSTSYSAPSPASTGPSPKTWWPIAANSPSPRRAFNARSALSPSTTSSLAGAKAPREHYVESSTGEKSSRYVDAGTQYSPDGYPPTYSHQGNPPSRVTVLHNATTTLDSPSTSKKRKEVDPPHSMSTSATSSTTSSGRLASPNEPDVRRDPSAPQSGVLQSSSTDLPPTELQEARSTHGHSSNPKRSKPEPGNTKIMPLLYQNCNAKDLGQLIANMLMELLRLNDRIPLRDGRLTRFHSRAPPGISVSDYLQRLIHHATLSPPILLSMVYYIDKLCQVYPIFTINSLTVHRFLITAATVAAKGLSDSFWTNPTYAKIGGIPVTELATLELDFLEKVQWKIVPRPEVLEDYYRSLVERTEGYMLEGDDGASRNTSLGGSEEGERNGDEQMTDEPT